MQIDDYECKYGETDRSEFDGEFIVPAEVRNRMNSSKGSLRIHGGLLTISRSRTFLTLSSNNRTSIHNSTPDLSRSVPNTPGSNHKLSLTSSYDSVLEENEEEGVMVIRKGKEKKKNGKLSSIQHIFENVPTARRKSEDFLESKDKKQHARQSSDHAYRLIPRVKNPTTAFIDGYATNTYNNNNNNTHNAQTVEIKDLTKFSASTSKSTASLNSESTVRYSQWGNVRSSNSFAADLNATSLSSYSIPRVTLSHQKTDTNHGMARKSLPENRSAIVLRQNLKDPSNYS
jgi:hypothetical protein